MLTWELEPIGDHRWGTNDSLTKKRFTSNMAPRESLQRKLIFQIPSTGAMLEEGCQNLLVLSTERIGMTPVNHPLWFPLRGIPLPVHSQHSDSLPHQPCNPVLLFGSKLGLILGPKKETFCGHKIGARWFLLPFPAASRGGSNFSCLPAQR